MKNDLSPLIFPPHPPPPPIKIKPIWRSTHPTHPTYLGTVTSPGQWGRYPGSVTNGSFGRERMRRADGQENFSFDFCFLHRKRGRGGFKPEIDFLKQPVFLKKKKKRRGKNIRILPRF